MQIVDLLLQVPGVDPTALDNEALKSAIRLGWSDVVCLLIQDDRVRRTITDFGLRCCTEKIGPDAVVEGKLFQIATRAAVRRKLLATMRENAVKSILLLAWARSPLPDAIRQKILLYSHGIWLPGATEQDNLNVIRSIMRRGRLGRALNGDQRRQAP